MVRKYFGGEHQGTTSASTNKKPPLPECFGKGGIFPTNRKETMNQSYTSLTGTDADGDDDPAVPAVVTQARAMAALNAMP